VSVLIAIAMLPAGMPSPTIPIVVPWLLIMLKVTLLLPVSVRVVVCQHRSGECGENQQ
jgi:hypothetical protein